MTFPVHSLLELIFYDDWPHPPECLTNNTLLRMDSFKMGSICSGTSHFLKITTLSVPVEDVLVFKDLVDKSLEDLF